MNTPSQEDDEDDINPLTMLSLNDDNASVSEPELPSNENFQRHHIRSIDSTVLIRQLPSEGLSFKLWPAASTLVNLLDDYRHNPTKNPLKCVLPNGVVQLNILELGSGTGLVGMAAAAILGAKVTVTDLPHVIPNLQFNVDANAGLLSVNGGAVDVAPLCWGEACDVEAIGREFDVVVGSDVVYHDHLYEPLLETLRLLLNCGEEKERRKFVMSHLRRWKKEAAFFKKARKLFEVETIHVDQPSDGRRIGVVVYCMTGKSKRS